MVGIVLRAEDQPSTLHLPRILCLHGGGTNSRIFRAQCRVLEKRLKPYFRLIYAQAPFHSKPGSDVVSVFQSWGPFYAWFDPAQTTESISTEVKLCLQKAIAKDDIMGATGELVGLMGFSQGAKVSGSLLQAQRRRKTEREADDLPMWKFAILLAGRGPLVSVTKEVIETAKCDATGFMSRHTPTPLTRRHLNVQTLHVHGLRDSGLDLHRKFLHENFDQRHTRLIEWDGEHRVPIKSKDVQVVMDEILAMARRSGILQEND
ncbi:hypothetical protein MMC10_009822 [Thelotrema lepadinum]|nr:hypothetical protein [Thelotrema lepadinum]